jgi:hypothetical protein
MRKAEVQFPVFKHHPFLNTIGVINFQPYFGEVILSYNSHGSQSARRGASVRDWPLNNPFI